MSKEYDIIKVVDSNGNTFNLENINEIRSEYSKIVFPDGFVIDLKSAKTYYTSNDNSPKIKDALLEQQSLKETNPSEALECLERLEYYHTRSVSNLGCKEHRLKDISTIKQALIKAEQDKKKATAWDIVISKNVDMLLIKKYDNVSDYNSAVWLSGREKLTEEGFKTIKEVLEK